MKFEYISMELYGCALLGIAVTGTLTSEGLVERACACVESGRLLIP